jgi:hypothetical protein
VRELAQYRWPDYENVFRWPIAEALRSYEEWLRASARRDFEQAMLLWFIAAQAVGKKAGPRPKEPPILRG